MASLNVSLSADQLSKRIQDRLRGLNSKAGNTLLWSQNNSRVLIYIDSLKARMLTGWLLCNLDLQTDQTGRQTLQFVFYLGPDGSGVQAAATINAANAQGAQLAEIWGATLQRVIWDAVLDALELFVHQSSAQHPGIAIQEFSSGAAGLTAVLTGDK